MKLLEEKEIRHFVKHDVVWRSTWNESQDRQKIRADWKISRRPLPLLRAVKDFKEEFLCTQRLDVSAPNALMSMECKIEITQSLVHAIMLSFCTKCCRVRPTLYMSALLLLNQGGNA